MAVLTLFSRKLLLNALKPDARTQITNNCVACTRLLSYTTQEYDGNPDPGPVFIKQKVQTLLRTLTRVDLSKVYRRRKLGEKNLSQPTYKFLTTEQLEEALNKVKQNVDEFIQIPPVLATRQPINKTHSKDPGLQGLETSRLVFTDITFGVRNSERLIVVRETDGTLRDAEWNVRDRVNQLYFPISQRSIKVPKLFEDKYLESLLERREYEFILDRACAQFEPDDAKFQKVVTIVYQHLNDNNAFESLRSTRHFGSLAFFLAWHKNVDNLLIDCIETGHIDEATALIDLYGQIHKIDLSAREALETVAEFIAKYANKKAALELAVQSIKESTKQRKALEEGIQRAHGIN